MEQITYVVGCVDSPEIVRRRRGLRAKRKRVRDLEDRAHRECLCLVGTSTIEEEVGQVSVYARQLAQVGHFFEMTRANYALFTSLEMFSIVPGCGRSKDLLQAANRP